ncbi:MAG: hypothetical protein CMD72_03485 [Gammaproteobacteria bacterium]|nr:hypothetical protein [Gammaproteobacteria bacterium]|tara:strand:- start:347 stop:1675 length:1329 start_codon:yes stop_codon:yes gene_type:complete
MSIFNLKDFLKQGLASFFVQFLGQLCGFLTSVLLANYLSPSEFGNFYFCFSLVLVIALICQVGTPLFLTKQVSVLKSKQKLSFILNKVVYSFCLTLLAITFIISIGYLIFKNDDIVFINEYRSFFNFICIAISLTVYINFVASIYRGFGYVIYAFFIDGCLGIMLTLFSITLFTIIFGSTIDDLSIFKLFTFSLFLTLFIALTPLIFIKNKFKYLHFDLNEILKKAGVWNRSIKYLAAISIVAVLNDHLSILTLGALSTSTQVGFFKVAMQLSLMLVFGLMAINAIIVPRIASLYSENKIRELQILLTYSVRLSFIFTLLVFIFILLFGQMFISYFFGEIYLNAYSPLLILCIGQIVNVCFGPVWWITNMTGREAYTSKVLSISLLINFVLSIILAPKYGSIGVAISAAICLIFCNITLYFFILKELKLNSSIFYVLNKGKT